MLLKNFACVNTHEEGQRPEERRPCLLRSVVCATTGRETGTRTEYRVSVGVSGVGTGRHHEILITRAESSASFHTS